MRLGSDSVLVSGIGDPVARKLADADAKARRKANEPPAQVLLFPREKPVLRASWLRVPPIMKLIQETLGKEMVDYFLVDNPFESIRIFAVGGGTGRVYDIDRDPTELRAYGGGSSAKV